LLAQTRAYGTCECGQVNHHARQSVLGRLARRRVAIRPILRIYAIKVLPTSMQSRFCPRAPKTEPCAVQCAPRAIPRAARAAYRVRGRAHCGPTAASGRTQPHMNPSRPRLCPRGAAASLTIPPRGAGLAAAHRAVAERNALHPPLRHLHTCTSTGKQGQPAYPRLSPPPARALRRHRRRCACAGTQSLILLRSLRPIPVRTHPIPHPSSLPNFLCQPTTRPPRRPTRRQPHPPP
jgi:hypothetical protein